MEAPCSRAAVSAAPRRGGTARWRTTSGRGEDVVVIVAARGWHCLAKRPEALVRRAATATLREMGSDGALAVLLTDNAGLKRLNCLYRAKAKPTNVLSFPAPTPGWLGDVAVALGVVRREAQATGRAASAHLAHLVIHGALHLIGYDHSTAGQARRMERAEARIMRRLGLPNPWKEGRGATARRHKT